jgi:caffeoyl-CoA O-methyltransferase
VPFSTALVSTDRLDRPSEQLLTDLGPGAETTQTPDGRAVLALPAGCCVVNPLGSGLELRASADDPARLAAVQDALTAHLARYAGQDDLDVRWSAPVSGDEAEPVHPVAADYCAAHSTPPGEVLADLVAETRAATGGAAGMQVSADEGGLLTMLTRLAGARLAVEVGTFTGYSSICIARGLAAGGRLIACDVSREWTSIAARYWARAGLADRIELKLGPALETLRALPAETVVDFAFIDADKQAYPAYYEELLRRLRPGGLIVLDNVFLGGRVFDPACQEERHAAMRDLNQRIAADERVDAVMLSVRDGLTVARKRER